MISISTEKRASLGVNGSSNNPILAWDNLAASGSATTMVGTSTASASYLLTGSTYDPWRVTPAAGAATARFDLLTAKRVSFVSIAAHNLGAVGATVSVEYSTGGATWIACGSSSVVATGSEAIGFWFAAITARYWRVVITGATGQVVVGSVFVCDPLILPTRLYQGYTPPITPTSVALQSNVSEGQHLLGSAVVIQGSTVSAPLNHLPATFVRGSAWLGFQRHYNAGKGFLWAWRPSKYGDLFYGWRSGDALAPTNSGPLDYMSVTLNMRLFHGE